MRISVTGGSGELGQHVVRRLVDDGHQVLNLDRAGTPSPALLVVDLRDYGQVADALLGVDDRHEGFDAVVHLGAIPAAGILPDAATFEDNMLSIGKARRLLAFEPEHSWRDHQPQSQEK